MTADIDRLTGADLLPNATLLLWRACQASRLSRDGDDSYEARMDVRDLECEAIHARSPRIYRTAVRAIEAALTARNPAARRTARSALADLERRAAGG